MIEPMKWEKLLSRKRFRGVTEEPEQDKKPDRNPFSKDADRVIYSSAFRRLHDKTQVQPFPKTDYTRTRLTHSLEVSSVGRSLGFAVGEHLLKHHPEDFRKIDEGLTSIPGKFGVIVETACLAHDLGNPPFGHAGEDAIRYWFDGRDDCKPTLDDRDDNKLHLDKIGLAVEQRADLVGFDGNAQGFRIITRLQGWREEGGLQLSCATLGAFSKYPFGSFGPTSGRKENAPRNKFGYFQDDRLAFSVVAKELDLLPRQGETDAWCHHPLAFLTEAADDICYLIVDIEDACRAGTVPFEKAAKFLRPIAEESLTRYAQIHASNDKLSYLRAKAIGVLVKHAVKAFVENYAEICSGQFRDEILSRVPSSKLLSDIRSYCKETIFRDGQKLEAEAAGHEVIVGLLEVYSEGLDDWLKVEGNVDDMKSRNRRLVQLIPDWEQLPKTRYKLFLKLTDYVSGMTDRFAVKQFRKLKGISVGVDRA